jgi:hypothetical protein
LNGVEELRLCSFFAGHELNVIHQQNVNAPVPFPEIENPVIADGVDHLVHEPFGRDVSQFQAAIMLQHVLTDGMHQVRLSETNTSVNEQRVV